MVGQAFAIWFLAIHAALTLGAWCYAKFLNQKKIHEWYSPDRVYLTVMGGDALIGLALTAFCVLGVLPWLALGLYASLHIAAGLPIIIWQERKTEQRRRDVEAIENRRV
jgi:hypothetical protein